ncbi:MAG: TadE/TadG family type IV pilus assembly protein [Pseudomonadota bacterium]
MRQIKLRAFWRQRDGQVAIITALMMLPILAVAGFSIDAARQVSTKKAVQHATDMAALAGAHAFRDGVSASEAMRVGTNGFYQNLPINASDIRCSVAFGLYSVSETVRTSANCTIPTVFGRTISGKARTRVRASARAEATITTLDLALVLDVSGSMNGTKITALRTAANDLVDNLVTPTNRTRISIIPYGSGVNAGRFGQPALGRAAGYDPEGDGLNRICVTERQGDNAFTDAAPESADTYVGPPSSFTAGCPTLPVLPLTRDATQLENQINALAPGGLTAGHTGVAWGWYSISPRWTDIWPTTATPLNYGNPDNLKALVLMTDGDFNLASSSLSAGFAATLAESLCTAMKAEGVVVFTIAFDAPSTAEDLMRNCATSETGHYFDAVDEAGLESAFEEIASKFQGVGLTR